MKISLRLWEWLLFIPQQNNDEKVFLVIAFLSMVLHAQAQLFSKERLANLETFDNRFLSWGYFLGLNQYDFKLEYENQNTDFDTDILVDAQMGFNVGLIGDLRINRYMNLRLEPGIYFTQRNLIFPGFEEDKDKIREVKSTYIHVPLLLKLSTKGSTISNLLLSWGFPDPST